MKVQLLSGYAGLLGTTQTHIPEGRGLVLFLFSKKSIRSVTKYVMSTWWKWHSPGVSLPWESILSRGLEIGTTWWCGARSPGFGVGPPGLRCQPSHYHLRPVITPPPSLSGPLRKMGQQRVVKYKVGHSCLSSIGLAKKFVSFFLYNGSRSA